MSKLGYNGGKFSLKQYTLNQVDFSRTSTTYKIIAAHNLAHSLSRAEFLGKGLDELSQDEPRSTQYPQIINQKPLF